MTKKPVRQSDGFYHVNGKKYHTLIGSRTQVMNQTCYKTSGNLTKDNLMVNKWGRIVSKKKHFTEKKQRRLQKHGWTAKKGKFGAVRIEPKNKTRKQKK
jgi:DVNP family